MELVGHAPTCISAHHVLLSLANGDRKGHDLQVASSVKTSLAIVCAKCGCHAQSKLECAGTCANPSARQVFARLVARVPRRPSPKRGNARMMQPWRLLPDAEVVKA